MKKRILIVSRDLELRAAAARNLQSAGYEVELAEGEERSRALLAAGHIDAAIVQPSLLGASGPQLMSELEKAVDHVIVLSNGSDEAGKLAGSLHDIVLLQLPVDWTQLLDRMANLLASVKDPVDDPKMPTLLGFEGRTVDLAGHTFFGTDGLEVSLTRAEFQLLSIFLRTPRRVLSRDLLRNALVGRSADSYDRSIDMLVARLRRKIEPDPNAPHFILTVPGVGYKFSVQPQRAEPMAHAAPRDPPKLSLSRLQRRQITVLACQLGGIGALATKRDPEDLYDAKERVCQVAASIMEMFGGAMISVPGDRLALLFRHSRIAGG